MPHTLITEEKDLARLVNGEPRGQGSPYIGVAFGTAQVKKLVEIVDCFGNVGKQNRFQSLMLYDTNQYTIDWVRHRLKSGGATNSKDVKVLTPSYIPGDAGFARDPWAYKERVGGLEEDYENMIFDLKDRSETIESDPQMIMAMMGYGSHGLLGWDILERIRSVFPKALLLVVITTPEDPLVRRQATVMLEEYFAKIDATDDRTKFILLDDNKSGGKANDRKFAVFMAAIEQASTTDPNGSPTIVDLVNGLSNYDHGRWLGVNVSHPIPLPTRRRFSIMPPWTRYGVMNGKTKDLEILVSSAAADICNDRWQLADHQPPNSNQLKNTFMTLPVEPRQLDLLNVPVRRWIKGKLSAAELAEQKFAFASGDFGAEPSEWGLSPAITVDARFLTKAIFPLRWVGRVIGRIFCAKRPRYYCHVGQIYINQQASQDFREVPSLRALREDDPKVNTHSNRESSPNGSTGMYIKNGNGLGHSEIPTKQQVSSNGTIISPDG